MSYRPNPFFASTNTFFAPSIGDKVDSATAKAQELAGKAKQEGAALKDQAYNRLQDVKEVAKDSTEVRRSGADLYSR